MEQTGKANQRRQPRRTPEEINSILVSYESSGLSVKEKRYRNTNQAKGFVELRPGLKPSAPMAGLFAEYRGIHFYQPVDPAYLKSLLS